jgi:hypothetical protein
MKFKILLFFFHSNILTLNGQNITSTHIESTDFITIDAVRNPRLTTTGTNTHTDNIFFSIIVSEDLSKPIFQSTSTHIGEDPFPTLDESPFYEDFVPKGKGKTKGKGKGKGKGRKEHCGY